MPKVDAGFNANTGSVYTHNARNNKGGVLDILQFPGDIGSVDGTSNYMVIYINQLENSPWKLPTPRSLSGEGTEAYDPAIMQSNSTSRILTRGRNAINDSAASAQETYNTAAGFAQGLGVPGAEKIEVDKNLLNGVYPNYVRSSVIIALPIPEQLTNTYNADWGMMETTSKLLEAASIIDAASSGKATSMQIITERLKVSGATAAANLLLGDAAGSLATKSIKNQRKELIFGGNLPRGFNFTWNLYPRNEDESKALWDIIQMLKIQMLSEVDLGAGDSAGMATAGLFINFPSTFEFEFYTNGERNDWMFKSTTCAITSLDTNYTPSGTATFFKKTGKEKIKGNAPMGVSLSISFMETEILDKNRIDMDRNFSFNNKRQGSLGGTL